MGIRDRNGMSECLVSMGLGSGSLYRHRQKLCPFLTTRYGLPEVSPQEPLGLQSGDHTQEVSAVFEWSHGRW